MSALQTNTVSPAAKIFFPELRSRSIPLVRQLGKSQLRRDKDELPELVKILLLSTTNSSELLGSFPRSVESENNCVE